MTNIAMSDLDPTQCIAVERSLSQSQRIAATSGPAGSGKTTLMRFVYAQLSDNGYRPVIAAPTGKAARRVRQATGCPALTVHMLLQYTKPGDIDEKTGKPVQDSYPQRCRTWPLEYDNVLVDEYAMVPHELHRNIIDALPPGGRLITFGDIAQLNPIEQNARLAALPTPFRSLLDKFNGVRLSTVHRQSEGSGILENSLRVLRGSAPGNKHDFAMHITDRPVDRVRELLATADYRSLDNQIIVPSNKSWIGTLKLNDMLQRELQPLDAEYMELPRHKWDKHPISVAVGDKVVMTKNWYTIPCSDGSEGVFNGEVGRVLRIDDDEGVVIDFEDRIATIPPAMEVQWGFKRTVVIPQRDIALAYALTTHKCQGSEYQHVTYVMNKSVTLMLNRRNLYTGITRARKHVNLVTDMRGLSLSLSVLEQRSW